MSRYVMLLDRIRQHRPKLDHQKTVTIHRADPTEYRAHKSVQGMP